MVRLSDSTLAFLFLLQTSLIFGDGNFYSEISNLRNVTCSGSDVIFVKRNVPLMKCAMYCNLEKQCSGFTFRKTDLQCMACQGSIGTVTYMDDGVNYFSSKYRKWGQACSSNSECIGEHQKCIDGICICTPGYSFLNTTWSCQAGCNPYGDTFQRYGGHHIIEKDADVLTGVTLSTCLQACLNFNPTCLSVDYTSTLICYIQTTDALQVPDAYRAYAGVDYHHRNCL